MLFIEIKEKKERESWKIFLCLIQTFAHQSLTSLNTKDKNDFIKKGKSMSTETIGYYARVSLYQSLIRTNDLLQIDIENKELLATQKQVTNSCRKSTCDCLFFFVNRNQCDCTSNYWWNGAIYGKNSAFFPLKILFLLY